MPQDAVDRARIRAFHRDRSIVKKISQEGSALAVDRMTEANLWNCLDRLLLQLWAHTREGRDVESARLARDLQAVAGELYTRGQQLTLPL